MGSVQYPQAHAPNGLRQKRTPRQQPDQNHSQEEEQRKRAVVDGIPFANVAEEMFIHEVKPQKPSSLARGGIPERSQPVPGHCSGQKNQRAGQQSYLEKMPQVSHENQKRKNDGARKYNTDEALGQNIERDGHGESPAREQRRLRFPPALEEKIQAEPDPQSDEKIRDSDSGKQIRSKGSDTHNRRPKSGIGGQEGSAHAQ